MLLLACNLPARPQQARQTNMHTFEAHISYNVRFGATRSGVVGPECKVVTPILVALKRFMAVVHKQQSRRRYAANGFALSPIRAVFSDSIVRVVEREVK